jgi:Spy/CpxP family protein refolding chaperone
MNNRISQFARLAGILAVGALFHASFAFAADEAAPAQAAPATPLPTPKPQPDGTAQANRAERTQRADRTERTDRGDRGNVTTRNFGGRGGFPGLNLDEKQSELLREALQAEGDELRKLYEKLQAATRELVKAVVAEKYDDKVVREKADAVSKLQTEITMLRAKAFSAVSPTLNPEQREQIENNRVTSSIITGAGVGFGQGGFGGGGPPQQQDQFADRNFRRGERGNNNNGPGGGPGTGDPNQFRRRDRPGATGQ